MSPSLFSVTIFFVVLREALEACIIVSVLLSLVDQIFHDDPAILSQSNTSKVANTSTDPKSDPSSTTASPRVLRKLKLQVILGSLIGLVVAIAIGAAFIVIWFTQARDLWIHSEQLWEGIFELIASVMIFAIGVAILKMENARTKWRIKLQDAFNGRHRNSGAKTSRWVLFILPMITILRLEAVVFIGGVSLAEPASSIPIPTIVGIICGIVCGTVVYQFASRTSKCLITAFRIFLICMTNFILLIGAGLFSKAVWAFEENNYIKLIGASSDDAAGVGPGSYNVLVSVWHLDCCNAYNGGWSVFNAVFGWQNSATLGSVLSYVFYWLAVIVVLVYYKFREGRTNIFGWESANGRWRRQRHEAQQAGRDIADSKDSQVDIASQTNSTTKS